MEDEGRHAHIKGPLPKSKAEVWLKAQEGEYFKPSDYYLVEVHEDFSKHETRKRR